MQFIFSRLILIVTFICAFALTAHAASPSASMEQVDASGLLVQKTMNKIAIAPGEETTISVLLRCIAPKKKEDAKREPLNIALVIDRSGSMSSEKKMDYAIAAATLLVRTLDKEDQLSIIIYDDKVETLVPLGPIKNKDALIKSIQAIYPRGYTFLSGGLEAGISQFVGKEMKGSKRVLLLSDGLANHGEKTHAGVAKIGANARNKGITVSSMGLGQEYDETMMERVAQRGGGMYYYVKDSEDLSGFFRQELALAQNPFTKNLQVRFVPTPQVTSWKVFGYSTLQNKADNSVTIEMGDLHEGEERQILLELKVKGGAAAAEQALANITLDFMNASSKAETAKHALAIPVLVSVVTENNMREEANKAIEPAAKIVNEEVALNKAEEAHVEALEELNKGNLDKAKSIMQAEAETLKPMAATSPALANKLALLNKDREQADAAASNESLRQTMTKSGKEAKYLAAQGKKEALMLTEKNTGARVERLQRLLQKAGYYKGEINGKYSDEVAKAVKEFQKAKGLSTDGVAGQTTLDALGF